MAFLEYELPLHDLFHHSNDSIHSKVIVGGGGVVLNILFEKCNKTSVWVGCIRMMYNLFCIDLSLFQPPTIVLEMFSVHTRYKVADQCVPQAQSAIAVNFSVLVHS